MALKTLSNSAQAGTLAIARRTSYPVLTACAIAARRKIADVVHATFRPGASRPGGHGIAVPSMSVAWLDRYNRDCDKHRDDF